MQNFTRASLKIHSISKKDTLIGVLFSCLFVARGGLFAKKFDRNCNFLYNLGMEYEKTGFFAGLWKNFLDSLYPDGIKCLICGCELVDENRYSLCEKCLESLPKNDGKVCLKCGEKIDSLANYCLNCKNNQKRFFSVARAPLLFDGAVKLLIHGLKYNHGKYIAKYLGEFLIDEFEKNKFSVDVVVPIPLNPHRLKQREYNQAELLCYPLCKHFNLELDTENLMRVVDTPTQTELTKQERKANLASAFSVKNKSAFAGKTVLLVDDVYTTGATMEEASKVLLKAGAVSVIALSVAHTVPIFMRSQDEESKED